MMAAPRQTSWTLAALLGAPGVPDVPVGGLALDSRNVRPGDAFFAMQGTAQHGAAWVGDAVARGACAVLTDLDADDPRLAGVPAGVAVVPIGAGRERVGEIASRFYGEPTRALDIVAVTGTNGKSSIAWLVAGALSAAGRDAALLGTLGGGRPQQRSAQTLTTPDAVGLHAFCAGLVDDGVGSLAMEASSHALDQHRLAGAAIDVAVFSNLSRDHLDYHGDMAHYFEAKALLFARADLRARIVCIDDAAGQALYARHAAEALWVSSGDAAADRSRPHLRAVDVRPTARGIVIDWAGHDAAGTLASPLTGRFNAQNLLLAMAALGALGLSPQAASEALAAVAPPPGRLERVGGGEPAVYVDYAHTPEALTAALDALRPHCRGRVWCVFGCGGERDRGKRAPMARAAAAGADVVVVTSDNPRGEDPASIIADIAAGFDGAPHHVEPDRRAAIDYAVARAAPADVVLIAGKGHETTQHIGTQRLPFDDAAVARIALARRGGGGS